MKSKISLRPWRVEDAVFVCYMRNNPALNRWYRQEGTIDLEKQRLFISSNESYNGQIIELNKVPIGVLAIQRHGEISIVLEEKHFKYLPPLLKQEHDCWGNVFVGNPILRYLLEAGFVTHCVKERAYYKKDYGLIDAICVRK